jgi:hypothetical protein
MFMVEAGDKAFSLKEAMVLLLIDICYCNLTGKYFALPHQGSLYTTAGLRCS